MTVSASVSHFQTSRNPLLADLTVTVLNAQSAADLPRGNHFTLFHSVRDDLSWRDTDTDTLRVLPHQPSLIVSCVYVRVVCDRGLSRIQEADGINTRGLGRSSLVSLSGPHKPSVNTPRQRLLFPEKGCEASSRH